jgi:electron transport complex protein RnfB
MVESNDVYRKLQQHIDERMPVGFPRSESGADIRILKHLFTPEEANLVLYLSALPESIERIYKRVKHTGITMEELEQKLDSLVKKGLIMGGSFNDPVRKTYSTAQYAIGMFEFQVDKLYKDLAQDADEYNKSVFYKEFFRPNIPNQMRTIPVEQSVVPEHHISTYDDVTKIIENAPDPIVIINCVCKQGKKVLGESCSVTDIPDTCMGFGNLGAGYLELGSGRVVSKDEALERLKKYQELGLVLQPNNSQDSGFICACCGDCCQNLLMVKQFPRPADYFASNFHAVVDADVCEGCGICVERCQMQAVSLVSEKATINYDRCIGCGNCVVTCESGAIQLEKKEKEMVPPKDFNALLQKIMIKKRGFLGSMKMMGKMLLKKQI